MRSVAIAVCSFVIVGSSVHRLAGAQLGGGIGTPSWLGQLLLSSTDLTSLNNPATTQEELPGLGHRFVAAVCHGRRPRSGERHERRDLRADDDLLPAGIGVVLRATPPGIEDRVAHESAAAEVLLRRPQLRRRLTAHPDRHRHRRRRLLERQRVRIRRAHGLWRRLPDRRLGLRGHDRRRAFPLGSHAVQFGYDNWPTAVTSVNTAFPNDRVLSGSLVDDSCSFSAPSCGRAYYDLFKFENRTLEQNQDTVKNGS